MTDEQAVAKQMYFRLCGEIVDIAKRNPNMALNEVPEYDRVKEIYSLIDLLDKEYGVKND